MSVKFRDLLFGTLEGTGSLKLDTVKSFFVIGLAASIAYQGKTLSFSEFSAHFDSFRINSCHQPVPKTRPDGLNLMWSRPSSRPSATGPVPTSTSISARFLLWPRGNSPVMESSLDSSLTFWEDLNSSGSTELLLLLLSSDRMSSTS